MGNIAAILSFFIPGLGQLYNKEVKKGFIFNIGIITSIVLALNSTSFLFEFRFLRAISLLIYFFILASIIWWWSVFDASINTRVFEGTGKQDPNPEFEQFFEQGYRFPKLNYWIDVLSRMFEIIIVTYFVVVLLIADKGKVEQLAYDIGAHDGVILLLLMIFVFYKVIAFPAKMINTNWDRFEELSSTKRANLITIRTMLDSWTFVPLLFFLGFVIVATIFNQPSLIFASTNPEAISHMRNITAFTRGSVLLIVVLFPVYLFKLLSIVGAKIDINNTFTWNLRQIWLDLIFGITRLYGIFWISYTFVTQLEVSARGTVANILGGISYTILALLFYLFSMIIIIVLEVSTKTPVLLD